MSAPLVFLAVACLLLAWAGVRTQRFVLVRLARMVRALRWTLEQERRG